MQGRAAVSDTGRTPTRLLSDIIGLFPLLTPPIREQYRRKAPVAERDRECRKSAGKRALPLMAVSPDNRPPDRHYP